MYIGLNKIGKYIIIFLFLEQSHGNSDEIDLNDPEVNKAAVKIQANYRGHLTRKNLPQ